MYNKIHTGYMGKTPTAKLQEFNVIDNRVRRVHQLVVHRFQLSDADDPDLYAAVPLLEWQNTEKGKWIMEHAAETPVWHRYLDHVSFGYAYAIEAKLWDKDYTFYQLKWGQNI